MPGVFLGHGYLGKHFVRFGKIKPPFAQGLLALGLVELNHEKPLSP